MIFWHPRLIHGGSEVINKSKTRLSYVTHYMRVRDIIFLKHFSGFPLLLRLILPKDLDTRRNFYKNILLSPIIRYLRIITEK